MNFKSLYFLCLKPFLEAETAFVYILGGLSAHIAIVPGLIDNSRYFAFINGVAENEAVAPGVFHKPLLGGGVCLKFIEVAVVGINNIHCQAQLMLAGAGNGNAAGGFNAGLLIAPSGLDQLQNFGFIELQLLIVASVC